MEDEKRINKVLAYQAKQLDEIEAPDTSGIEERIAASERLLSELGYALPPNVTRASSTQRFRLPFLLRLLYTLSGAYLSRHTWASSFRA